MTKSPQSTDLPIDVPMFHQEFRLGLVVYGGIALAIYMNGVCREFYNAVRGRGLYKLLKVVTDSDIIVDVISGTSAGGINGVLLSYALTNSNESRVVDFKHFADLWRDSGDIGRLLRTANEQKAIAGTPVESLLNGEEYYQSQLAKAFKRGDEPAPAGECFSKSTELDLFVTGTDLLGKVYKAFDNTGQLIEVKDHRTVFLLKHREGRKHPFELASPVISQALAKLCRITSCFPVAFPVVTVKLVERIQDGDPEEIDKRRERAKQEEKDKQYQDYKVDEWLVEWGSLIDRELPLIEKTLHGRQLHFTDGGVLDNRPFSYTVQEIYNRVAYRPVERRLFYIDPSPDQFLNSPKFNAMERPTIWKTAIDALVGMPHYESIANDLQEIKDRNKRVLRYRFLRATAESGAEQVVKQLALRPEETADGLKRRSIAQTQSLQAQAKSQADPQTETPATPEQKYLRCRLVGLRDRVLPLVLSLDRFANPDDQDRQGMLEEVAKLLTQYITDQKARKDREDFLHKLGKEVRNLDVEYALRKHFFLLEKICQLTGKSRDSETHKRQIELAQKIGAQIELLQVIQAGLEYMLKSKPVTERFSKLIQEARTEAVQPIATLMEDVSPEERRSARENIYKFLLCLHRFLLDSKEPPGILSHPDLSRPDARETLLQLPLSIAQNKEILSQLKARANKLEKEQIWLNLADLDSSILQYECKTDRQRDEENDSDRYRSILRIVEVASEDLISSCDLEIKDELQRSFQSFRLIDEEVYAYEYLSDIQAKEQIEIVRISPIDAQKGFGYGKGLDEKLAGDQLGAFGGFFKKSWRSNDILWGRLDGVNRIVDALITPESLKNLSHFLARQIVQQPDEAIEAYLKRQTDYLVGLLAETLPAATELERAEILANLLPFANLNPSTTLKEIELAGLVAKLQDLLVRAEHRAIVQSELGTVLEDAIDEQLNWNQQKVRPQRRKEFEKTLKQLNYNPVSIPATASEQQMRMLGQLNQLIQSLVDPRLLAGVAALLQANAQKEQVHIIDHLRSLSDTQRDTQRDIPPQHPGKDAHKQSEQYLDYLLQTAFPNSLKLSDSDRQNLIHYPLTLAKTKSVDDLYVFLNRILVASRVELNKSGSGTAVGTAFKDISDQLKTMLDQLQPTYSSTVGYFDRAITPFVASEMARASTRQIREQQQEDDYFRNQYRIGSEKLTDGVPLLILQNLAARTGLVLRDIVASKPTGDRVRPSLVYRFGNSLLQLFYWSVWLRSPKSFQVGRIPLAGVLIELLFPIGAVVLTLILVTQLPPLVLILAVSIMILALLYMIRSKLFR
jgi:patatin-related protein